MLFRVGPGSSGYNWYPEYIDWDCVLTLAAGATCAQGQAVCRNVSQPPSDAGADPVVLPTATGAGPVYGVYQGSTFTNSTTTPQTYQITVRKSGQGVVNATGATVGGALANTGALQVGAAPDPVEPGTMVGVALATGTATAPGAAIPAGLAACAISGIL
jgi:hypothetical protein